MLRSFGDSNIFGASYGEGPPRVLWLHGWARTSEDFTVAATTLAELGVASLALDLPGFGTSPPPLVAGGARHYAALVRPVLEEIAVEPLVLVGHSFGGRVATVLASTDRDSVRALILTGVPLLRTPSSSAPALAYRAQRWLHKRGLLSEARMETARQKFGSTDYRLAHGVMREVVVANVNEGYEAELATIVAPVDFLWGERDQEVGPDVAARAAMLLSGDHSMHVVGGVGHFLPLEVPDEVVRAVERALLS